MDLYRGTAPDAAYGHYQGASRGMFLSPTTLTIPSRSCTNATAQQVTKLCGPEPLTKWVVLGVVSFQFLLAHLLRDTSFFSWKFWLTAYVFGATCNQNLFLAIHEISHNLAFRSPTANRLFAIVANLPIAVPYSASFRVCSPFPSSSGFIRKQVTNKS